MFFTDKAVIIGIYTHQAISELVDFLFKQSPPIATLLVVLSWICLFSPLWLPYVKKHFRARKIPLPSLPENIHTKMEKNADAPWITNIIGPVRLQNKRRIGKIIIQDSLQGIPEGHLDISRSTGTVAQWTETGENGEKILYIAAEGGINACFCEELFADFRIVREIAGLEHLHTDYAFSMRSMFANCRKLESLDLHTFKTGHVKDMEGMFMNCPMLKDLQMPGDPADTL